MATRKEAAEHLFLSVQQFDKLRRDGVLPGPRGRAAYDLDALRRAYIEHIKHAQSKVTTLHPDQPPRDLKDQLDEEKLADIREKRAIRHREYIPVGELQDYCVRVATVVRAGLEALPGLVRQRIPHLRAAEVGVIEAEVAKVAGRIPDQDFSSAA